MVHLPEDCAYFFSCEMIIMDCICLKVEEWEGPIRRAESRKGPEEDPEKGGRITHLAKRNESNPSGSPA